ncbi:uncharacterized protein LOC131293560 [Anopheles ziemanni]|uniref:uncharacterized protein LOC131264386 n=1 Tax=Anopheles coustani TaxID=139045 RepID=UPI00265A5C31|nr:uncharacterized protein LOC131264386 [Anopheles coustani]XP_058177620.1 uncharacterized protein LOC131293560 [Anopheles ziemanni]
MALVCRSCSSAIVSSDNTYTCGGSCRAVYHGPCLGVASGVVKALGRPDTHIIWMCTECRDSYRSGWAGYRDLLTSTIAELKRDLSADLEQRLISAIAGIKRNLPKPSRSLSPVVGSVLQNAQLPGPSSDALLNTNTEPPAFHITHANPTITHASRNHNTSNMPKPRPMDQTLPPMLFGTSSNDDNTTTIPTVPIDEPRFWLYLTRIAPSASDEEVESCIKQRLNTNDVRMHKLLRLGRSQSTATFISFKVSLSLSLREKALDPSTWPPGVGFREFTDHRSPHANIRAPRIQNHDEMQSNMQNINPSVSNSTNVSHDSIQFHQGTQNIISTIPDPIRPASTPNNAIA